MHKNKNYYVGLKFILLLISNKPTNIIYFNANADSFELNFLRGKFLRVPPTSFPCNTNIVHVRHVEKRCIKGRNGHKQAWCIAIYQNV